MKKLNYETDSLTDFVRKSGGISIKNEGLKGECRDYFSITEGYNLLNNKTGKTLDYLLEGAMETGYLFFDADISDFLDALRKDVYSKKVFKKGCIFSFAKQDWTVDTPDFDDMFEDDILELTEEVEESFDLMPQSVFN